MIFQQCGTVGSCLLKGMLSLMRKVEIAHTIVFLYMKSECANFACVFLDQQDNICTFKKFQKLICFPGKLTFQKMYCSGVQTIYIRKC